jgi:hypothetical protein
MNLQRDAPPHGGIAVEIPTSLETYHVPAYQVSNP